MREYIVGLCRPLVKTEIMKLKKKKTWKTITTTKNHNEYKNVILWMEKCMEKFKKKQIVSHPLCTCTVNTATYILMDSFGHSTLSIF